MTEKNMPAVISNILFLILVSLDSRYFASQSAGISPQHLLAAGTCTLCSESDIHAILAHTVPFSMANKNVFAPVFLEMSSHLSSTVFSF